jgi:2-oxoglutarate ferredoxin oxidoreductase subunit delta
LDERGVLTDEETHKKGGAMASREMVKQEIQVSPNKKLVVTVSWCKACGICIEMCPRQVLGAEEVTQKVILIAADKCNGCGLCELTCPDYVFTIQELEDRLTNHEGTLE